MPPVALLPALLLILLLASAWSPARLGRAAMELHARLPGIHEVEKPRPKPKPGDQVDATISLLQLRDAPYRRGQPLAQWILDLEGKYVAIEGYMALGTLEGLSEFEFVPEECECGGSKVNHLVMVSLTDSTTRFRAGRFYMRGIFSAGELEEDDFVTSVYRLRSRAMPD